MFPAFMADTQRSARVPVESYRPADSGFTALYGGGYAPDEKPVTKQTSLSISAFWAGVTLISEAMSVPPINLHIKGSDGSYADIADQHPAHNALNVSINGWMTPSKYKSFKQSCLLLDGNGVDEIVRDSFGRACRLNYWIPENISYATDTRTGDPVYGISGDSGAAGTEWSTKSGGTTEWFPHTEVLHVSGFSTDGVIGRSILNQARSSLSLSMTIEDFGKKFFNKGRPAGFLTKPGKMTPEQKQILRDEWRDLYESVEKAFEIGILSGGLDWKSMGYTNDDAQFLQSRDYQVSEIARWLRIPLHMLGRSNKESDVSLEQRMLEFITFTLLPWATRWEEELNLKLLTPRERSKYKFFFDFEAFLRGDSLTRAKISEYDIKSGTSTIDEVRKKRRQAPHPNGIGSKPLVLASQLDTLENVINGTSGLSRNKPKPAKEQTQ